ncbi:hypothetical protein ACXZ1K_16090 [Pedobacter sp. PWIIR3]
MKTLYNTIAQSRYWAFIKFSSFTISLWLLLHNIPWANFSIDPTAGYIDPTIWMLILISLLCVPILVGISALLLTQLWKLIGLPAPTNIVSQFNALPSWQKLKFLFASYALLLLAGIGCLIAIC